MENPNKELAKLFLHELFGKKRKELIDELIHPDYHFIDRSKRVKGFMENDPDFITEPGIDSFRNRWEKWIKVYPNITYEITNMITEDNSVSIHWIATIFYTGLPHLDFKIDDLKVGGSHFLTIKDGKIWQSDMIGDFLTPLFNKGILIINHNPDQESKIYIDQLQQMGLLIKNTD